MEDIVVHMNNMNEHPQRQFDCIKNNDSNTIIVPVIAEVLATEVEVLVTEVEVVEIVVEHLLIAVSG